MNDDDLRELQVTEVVRQGGQLWFTLHHTYVGSEYNHRDDILLSEEDARALLAELQEALTHERTPAALRGTFNNPRTNPCSHQLYYGCAICDRGLQP